MKHFLFYTIAFLACLSANGQGSSIQNPGDPRPGAPIEIGENNIDLSIPSAYNQSGNTSPTLFNYTRTYTPVQPITNAGQLNNNTPSSTALQSTEYKDGWGRTIQKIHYDRFVLNKDMVECYDHRLSKTTTSFLPYSVNSPIGTQSKFQVSPFVGQKNYYGGLYPNETGSAVSQTVITGNPYNETINFQPGRSNIGNNKGTTTLTDFAASGEIIIFNEPTSAEAPEKLGTYGAGKIIVNITKNEERAYSAKYYDLEGRLICTKNIADTTWQTSLPGGNPGGGPSNPGAGPTQVIHTEYAWTYYIYDPFGRLRYVLSPKAVEKLKDASWTFSNQILDELCDYVEYDAKGRVTLRHKAGEVGNNEFVYDKNDRVVMQRSPQQQANGKWGFSCYDKFDRVIMTGLATSSSTRASTQTSLDAASPVANPNPIPGSSSFLYYVINEGTYYIPGSSTALSSAEIWTITDYDDYFLGGNNPLMKNTQGVRVPAQRLFADAEFIGRTNASGVDPVLSNKTRGLVTATKVKVIAPPYASSIPIINLPEWLETVHYYDEYGRTIQTHQTNVVDGKTITSSQYNFSGNKLVEIVAHNNAVCTNKPNGDTRIYRAYDYKYNGNLVSVKEALDNGSLNPIATYDYNELGQMSMKRIGNIETQDFDYNIRGQVTAINRPHVMDLMYQSNRKFGQIISYDSGLDSTQLYLYGKISGMCWRGADSSWPKHYRYQYDVDGKLAHADYRQFNSPITGIGGPVYQWNNIVDYSERDFQYDVNGNLRSLKRFGPNGFMDHLQYKYAYDDVSNKLQYVDDLLSSTSPPPYDFVNVGDSTDFEFDLNGNMKTDKNRGLTFHNDANLNKPNAMNMLSGDNTYYVYDALGNKLVEQTKGSIASRTDYCNDFIYKDNKLIQAIHAEGYTNYNDTVFNKAYFFVKDYLGNVRQLLEKVEQSSVPGWNGDIMNIPPIQNEPGTVNDDYMFATLINEVRGVKPLSVDPNDQWAAALDANDPNKRIGVVMMVNVMAGDRISLTADCYYEDAPEPQADVTAEDMLTSVMGALTGDAAYGGGEGGAPQFLNQMFSDANYLTGYEAIRQANTEAARPKSYLNYLFFDENMNLVASHSGAIQISRGDGDWIRDVGFGDNGEAYLEAGYNGTIIVYHSTQDGTVKPYWDNTKMGVYRGEIREEFHYYPYGNVITMSTINTPKKWLYQTKELDKRQYLYDFHARQYDPKLGRFNGLDPMGQFASGYMGMANDPVNFVDPDGKLAWFVPVIIGAGVGAYLGGSAANNNFNPGQWNWTSDRTYKGIFGGAFAGALSGATWSVGLSSLSHWGVLGNPTIISGLNYTSWAAKAAANTVLVAKGISVINTTASMINNFENGAKIFAGQYYLNGDKGYPEMFLQGLSRYTWEGLQTWAGYNYTHMRNAYGNITRVDYFGGATFATGENSGTRKGISIGNFLNIWLRNEITGSFNDKVLTDPLFMHEYGHTLDSRMFGFGYLFYIGIPSAAGAEWTEHRANNHAARYFARDPFNVDWSQFEKFPWDYFRK